MDASDCCNVNPPRVPLADDIPGSEMPMFRKPWEHIRANMPKKGGVKSESLNPPGIQIKLQTALEALYGHPNGDPIFDLR